MGRNAKWIGKRRHQSSGVRLPAKKGLSGRKLCVKEGDLMFEIDPRPFEAALDEAKSQLDQAQAVQLTTEADFEKS
jgi:hypothetical protein